MTLKAVLLDIDGTLLDSNDGHAQAWQEALREHGVNVAYDVLRPLVGKGGDKVLAEVAGMDENSAQGEQIGKRRRALFSERHLPHLQPTPCARALLLRFIADRLRLVVATSAGGEELESLLVQAGVRDLVDEAASSSDAKASKPDPDIIEAALRKAGLRPDEAIMLGDTPYDVEAAAAAGVKCVVVRCGGWWPDTAFGGALAVYDDPADLLRRMEDSPFHRGCTAAAPARALRVAGRDAR